MNRLKEIRERCAVAKEKPCSDPFPLPTLTTTTVLQVDVPWLCDTLEAALEALKGLTTNSHISLGDLVYYIREREGLGWDGPSVKAWSDAVHKAEAFLERLEK